MKLLIWLFSGILFFGQCDCQAADAKVALLLEHEQAAPWTNLLRSGLEKAAMDFHLETEVVIAPPGPGQAEVFRSAAASNNLVLVTGESLHELLRDNAANFRRTMFGAIDAGIRAPNIMCVTFADEQAAFLAGAAAAMLTKYTAVRGVNEKNVIGWLSGMDVPALRSLYNGYLEGARLIDPQITIAQQVAGSFTNADAAAAKMEQILSQGADVAALAAGAGNPFAKQKLSSAKGWRIDLDEIDPAPGALGAIVKAADKAVYEIIKSYAANNFKGKEILIYNLENGGVNFTGIDNFMKQAGSGAPASLPRRIAELRNEIIKGSIHLRSLRTRTLCDCLD